MEIVSIPPFLRVHVQFPPTWGSFSFLRIDPLTSPFLPKKGGYFSPVVPELPASPFVSDSVSST